MTSLLDQEETSVRNQPESNYQAWRRRSCEPEWIATEQLYHDYYGTDRTSKYTAFLECRTAAFFVRHWETHELRIKSNACRARWCPICGTAKSSYLARVVLDWCSQLKNIKLLTFTIKHSNAPLEHQIKHLYASFRKIRQEKTFRRTVRGGIWMFQIKRSRSDNLWHPHIHCIIDSDYLPHSWLSKIWSRITKTSKIVDIRSIRKPKFAAHYVSRYAVRPANLADLQPAQRLQLMLALHSKRLAGTWGTARVVKLTEPPRSDSKDWQSIGSWTEIVKQINDNDVARAIWMAYINGQIYTGEVFDKTLSNLADDPNYVATQDLGTTVEWFIEK